MMVEVRMHGVALNCVTTSLAVMVMLLVAVAAETTNTPIPTVRHQHHLRFAFPSTTTRRTRTTTREVPSFGLDNHASMSLASSSTQSNAGTEVRTRIRPAEEVFNEPTVLREKQLKSIRLSVRRRQLQQHSVGDDITTTEKSVWNTKFMGAKVKNWFYVLACLFGLCLVFFNVVAVVASCCRSVWRVAWKSRDFTASGRNKSDDDDPSPRKDAASSTHTLNTVPPSTRVQHGPKTDNRDGSNETGSNSDLSTVPSSLTSDEDGTKHAKLAPTVAVSTFVATTQVPRLLPAIDPLSPSDHRMIGD